EAASCQGRTDDTHVDDGPGPGSFEPDEEVHEVSQADVNTESDDEPEPLIFDAERATAFPLDSMGIVAGNAAKALVQRTQAPDAIAGQTILAALNVVAQRHIDVLIPQGGDNPHYGIVRPISCNLLTIATSGERKSALRGGLSRVSTSTT